MTLFVLLLSQHADRVHQDARDESANASSSRLTVGDLPFFHSASFTRVARNFKRLLFLCDPLVMYATTDCRVFIKLTRDARLHFRAEKKLQKGTSGAKVFPFAHTQRGKRVYRFLILFTLPASMYNSCV